MCFANKSRNSVNILLAIFAFVLLKFYDQLIKTVQTIVAFLYHIFETQQYKVIHKNLFIKFKQL